MWILLLLSCSFFQTNSYSGTGTRKSTSLGWMQFCFSSRSTIGSSSTTTASLASILMLSPSYVRSLDMMRKHDIFRLSRMVMHLPKPQQPVESLLYRQQQQHRYLVSGTTTTTGRTNTTGSTDHIQDTNAYMYRRKLSCLSKSSSSSSISSSLFKLNSAQQRYLQSEREYITIVTITLQTIHDTIDNLLDQQSFITDYVISFSQGVLTLKFPPHGTWVFNQQTPNLQIWVRYSNKCVISQSTTVSFRTFLFLILSSLFMYNSGPFRYRDRNDSNMMIRINCGSRTKDGLNLGHALAQEIHHIYPDLDPIELNV
jgi:hypothetical protein